MARYNNNPTFAPSKPGGGSGGKPPGTVSSPAPGRGRTPRSRYPKGMADKIAARIAWSILSRRQRMLSKAIEYITEAGPNIETARERLTSLGWWRPPAPAVPASPAAWAMPSGWSCTCSNSRPAVNLLCGGGAVRTESLAFSCPIPAIVCNANFQVVTGATITGTEAVSMVLPAGTKTVMVGPMNCLAPGTRFDIKQVWTRTANPSIAQRTLTFSPAIPAQPAKKAAYNLVPTPIPALLPDVAVPGTSTVPVAPRWAQLPKARPRYSLGYASVAGYGPKSPALAPELKPYQIPATSGGSRGIAPNEPHNAVPPPKRTKEGKISLQQSLGAFGAAFGKLTELQDYTNAVLSAMPPDVRAQARGQGLHIKLGIIYRNVHRIDMAKLVKNIIVMEVSDRVIGTFGQAVAKGTRNAANRGYYSSPAGLNVTRYGSAGRDPGPVRRF